MGCQGSENRVSELHCEGVPGMAKPLQLWRWRAVGRVMRQQPQAWGFAREDLKAHWRVGTPELGSAPKRVVASRRPAEHGPREKRKPGGRAGTTSAFRSEKGCSVDEGTWGAALPRASQEKVGFCLGSTSGISGRKRNSTWQPWQRVDLAQRRGL